MVKGSQEYILLVYGDANQVDPQDFIPIALIAPRLGGLAVQYIAADNAETKMMVHEVQEELRYYLVEKGEPDPWAYAVYHCGTASNWYSNVHWVYRPTGCSAQVCS